MLGAEALAEGECRHMQFIPATSLFLCHAIACTARRASVARAAVPTHRRGRRRARRRADRRATSASIRPRRACTSAICCVIMLLVRLQRHGHRPVALVGGGTGLIGDPGGKTASARSPTPTSIAANAAQIRKQLERFLDFTRPERRAHDRQRRVAGRPRAPWSSCATSASTSP